MKSERGSRRWEIPTPSDGPGQVGVYTRFASGSSLIRRDESGFENYAETSKKLRIKGSEWMLGVGHDEARKEDEVGSWKMEDGRWEMGDDF